MGGSVVCSSREGVSRIKRMCALLRLDMLVRRVVVRWEREGEVRYTGWVGAGEVGIDGENGG